MQVDDEKTAITVSMPEAGNVSNETVPLKRGAKRNTTSGWLVVDPQVNAVGESVWSAMRPLKLNEYEPPDELTSVALLQLSPPPGTTSGTHVPPLQVSPEKQVPHDPPQPSSPHSSPEQNGVQLETHSPKLQVSPEKQVPQDPPQPSSPHSRPEHEGVQLETQEPKLQVSPEKQVPHDPPQPSSPHSASAQSGVHPGMHSPPVQPKPLGQLPQLPPQPSSPHTAPSQLGVHATHAASTQADPAPQAIPQPPQF